MRRSGKLLLPADARASTRTRPDRSGSFFAL